VSWQAQLQPRPHFRPGRPLTGALPRTQTVLARKADLLEIPADEPEMLHALLSKLPASLDVDALTARALALYRTTPPARLRPRAAWRAVAASSVLKTARSAGDVRGGSLREGERLFARQERGMAVARAVETARKLAWRWRRPAGAVGAVLAAVLVAWWARKGGAGAVGAVVRWVAAWVRL